MPDLYHNKYRIPSARAPFWDYGWNAAYFITICTRDRVCWFGEIVDGDDDGPGRGATVETQNFASLPMPRPTPRPTGPHIQLTDIGKIAHECWSQIPAHFPFVKLGAFVVMPNHVHGIVIIDKPDDGRTEAHPAETEKPIAPSSPGASQPPQSPGPQQPKNRFGPQSQNLASIIRGFKVGVTKYARPVNSNFAWQPRYHDHIIRDSRAYQAISKYILNNPSKWMEDKFYAV